MDYLAYQDGELCTLDNFLDIREEKGQKEIRVSHRGFDGVELIWMDLELMKEDVSQLVDDFLKAIQDHGTPRQKNLI